MQNKRNWKDLYYKSLYIIESQYNVIVKTECKCESRCTWIYDIDAYIPIAFMIFINDEKLKRNMFYTLMHEFGHMVNLLNKSEYWIKKVDIAYSKYDKNNTVSPFLLKQESLAWKSGEKYALTVFNIDLLNDVNYLKFKEKSLKSYKRLM